MSERTLYAFLGGVAASGAKYKIEVLKVASGYQADAYSAGGSTTWTKPTLVERSGLLPVVLRKALTKFAEKTRPGRDRTYDTPMYGGRPVGAIPKELDGSDLPDHPLCWQVGRDLALLPPELHGRAVLVDGQNPVPSSVAVAQIITSPPAGARLALGQIVMLCETIADEPTLSVLMQQDGWLMTEKMEGDRGQLHHDLAGKVYLTNRSGEVVNCPPHIIQTMASMARGTSFDGEVISVDSDGAAQLYVGARANIQLFVAFDLLEHPSYTSVQSQPQKQRLRELAALLPPFQVPLQSNGPAIRIVRWAETYDAKLDLLEEVRRRTGEGWVLRNAESPYEGRRSYNWMRFRDREKELDAVVLDYKRGTGKFANTVGGVKCGLYDGSGRIRSIGWVGSGWSDELRAEFWNRWQAGVNGYVITVKSFGLSFADQVIRPSGVRIRTPGDKRPAECTFESEAGRPFGAMKGKGTV